MNNAKWYEQFKGDEVFTAENNQLVRDYLENMKLGLYEDYINDGTKRPEEENYPIAAELAQMKVIDDVLEELDRNLQQIEDGIFDL